MFIVADLVSLKVTCLYENVYSSLYSAVLVIFMVMLKEILHNLTTMTVRIV